LNILHVLYLMFLFGSLAFGLEALLLGLGGQLSVLYHRGRRRALMLALLIGIAVVSSSIITSAALGFGPLYFCASVLVYTLLASLALNSQKSKLIKPSPLPMPSPTTDLEIERMLQKRIFNELAEEKD